MAKLIKSEDKKKRIFDLFSQNLAWFLEPPEISFSVDCTNGIICPICTGVFYESDLKESSDNHLTLEHVPPESVGGKVRALVCKDCNSKSGTLLDSHLNKMFDHEDFVKRTPNSEFYTKISHNGNIVSSKVRITGDRTVVFDLDTKHSNPKYTENLTNHFKSVAPEKKFQLQMAGSTKLRSAHISLLRIAYLQLFSTFGHSIFLIPALAKVREQIMNPDQIILPGTYWLKYNFAVEDYGISIITEPTELRCFLVIFDLVRKNSRKQCAILLPGPTEPKDKIYQNLKDLFGKDGPDVQLKFEKIPNDSYLRNKKDTYALLEYWRDICKV